MCLLRLTRKEVRKPYRLGQGWSLSLGLSCGRRAQKVDAGLGHVTLPSSRTQAILHKHQGNISNGAAFKFSP
jgi:hypothetical protein